MNTIVQMPDLPEVDDALSISILVQDHIAVTSKQEIPTLRLRKSLFQTRQLESSVPGPILGSVSEKNGFESNWSGYNWDPLNIT
jgi:hypothetical protein